MRGDIVLRRTGGTKARPSGNYRASWPDGEGGRVTWNTRTSNETEARQRALSERDRRRKQPGQDVTSASAPPSSPPAAPPAPSPPPAPAASPPGGPPGGARPLAEALARAFAEPEASTALVPAPSAPPPEPPQVRRLHELFGKAMAFVTEGVLNRCVKWAGRQPAELDDDEADLLREGWRELGAGWFGRVEVGPWGKVVLGSVAAGVGMYMGGKPIEEKKPAGVLPPAGGDGGGG